MSGCQYQVRSPLTNQPLRVVACGEPGAKTWIGPNAGRSVVLCARHALFVQDCYVAPIEEPLGGFVDEIGAH